MALFPFDGAMRHSETGTYYLSPSMYKYACDQCLDSKRALIGNPKKQFYTFSHPVDTASPFLAYINQTKRCLQCKKKFSFSKEEQKHWYEELQFVVYSHPKHCLDCRKDIRTAKDLNTELSDLLKNGTPKNVDALNRISVIYEQMGNEEKAKAFRRAAERLN